MASSSSNESSRDFIFSYAHEDLRSNELRSRRLSLWTEHCQEVGLVADEPREDSLPLPEAGGEAHAARPRAEVRRPITRSSSMLFREECPSLPEAEPQPLVGRQVWHYSAEVQGWRRAIVDRVEPDGNLSLLCKDWPGWIIRRSKPLEKIRMHPEGRRVGRGRGGTWKEGRKARQSSRALRKVKQAAADKVRRAAHRKWLDAPEDHPIHGQLKFTHHINPLVAFRYPTPEGTVPFQVTIGRAKSKYHTLRIARLCYLKFEAGASKDEVLKYRESLYGELTE